MASFDAKDWYWLRSDGKLFSSAKLAVVDATDADYLVWLKTNFPATWPSDQNGAQTMASLQGVLSLSGLYVDLKAYAAAVRWGKVNGGVTYQGHPIDTDDDSRSNLMAEALAAQIIGTGFRSAWKCSDGSWLPIPDAATMIAFATSVRNYVVGCFAVEEALTPATKADVDNAAWPSTTLT